MGRAPSIITSRKSCHFCYSERQLEVHHCIHGRGKRKLADEDGLWVYLCHHCHHELHGMRGHAKDLELEQIAEYEWIRQRFPGKGQDVAEEGIKAFISRYGRNYV